MAGRHRGASAAVMFKAIMEGGTLEEADRAVRELRDIEVHKVRRQDRNLSAWMEETVQKARLGSAPPVPVGFVATELSMLPLCQHKQRATARQLRDPVRTTDKLEAIAWGAHSVPRMLQLGRRQMAAVRTSYAAPTFLSSIHDRGGTSQFIAGAGSLAISA